MAYYDKKIVYLSEMEYGSRIKGAGFVRIEFRGRACSLDMHVSGLAEIKDDKYNIYVTSKSEDECAIGEIYIHGGRGQWQGSYENGMLSERNGQEGLSINCTDIEQFVIRISDIKTVKGSTGMRGGQLRAAQMMENTKEKNAQMIEKEDEGARQKRKKAVERAAQMMEEADDAALKRGGRTKEGTVPMTGEAEEALGSGCISRSRTTNEKYRWGEAIGKTWEFCRKEIKQATDEQEQVIDNDCKIQMDAVILNDKWEQLCRIYQVVHPYEDEREYITIQPKDFVIMTGDYQHLANNSFLLHGFYNYRHIVLGREPDGCFYLGVPGVYYEREKMVALMFGFEAFECKAGRAEAGRFGYYLRKVQI